ncbi:MAG TPA: hypothetical protein VJL29_05745, partial [Thermoguttaceae bacterium]|nr:hypothetical protein [Thermoguttaceae bacterium]
AGLRAEGSPPSSLDGPRDVMAEVRRLGAEDPGLQAQLLAELQAADPSLWPLVTRSFRSRVAYGRQLREKEALAARANAQAQVIQSPIPNPQSLAPVEPNPALANDQSAVGAPAEPRIARLPATDPSLLDPEWLGPTVGFPSGGLTGGTTPKNSSITRPERLSENGDRRPPLNDEGTCPPNNPGASPRFRTDAGAAALEIRNPAFCRGVRSFGAITRFERDEFTPGQRVLLYAEIDHFQTERRPDGFHTALRSSYRIFDAVGRQVASRESAVMEECTLGPRRDYFLGCDFRLSESLRPGRHTLRLAIEDLKTGQTAEASIGFTIVGHKKHEVTRKD